VTVMKQPMLQLVRADFEHFTTVLGWNARETSALYKRLVRGGYIRQYNDEQEFIDLQGEIGVAWVEDLTDKGMQAIGVLHDPTNALIEALLTAREVVVGSEDIPEAEKPKVIDWLDRGISIARVAEGAAQIITKHLPPSG
jgi:hypothetical protein